MIEHGNIENTATQRYIQAMTTKVLQSAISKRPFRAVAIRLVNGQRVRISNPDHTAVHPEGNSLFLFERDGGYRIINIALIAELQTA